ncbi:DUF6476 family protein [Meinhardsimonia xiamenensis]|jgi:hypothetical protein|nr:DUF6476 family protein [Meinhardsimonia xiamenensis]
MDDTPAGAAEGGGEAVRHLRFLKALVTVLSVTMIAGFLVLIAVLVIRLPAPAPAGPPLPERIRLPEGAAPYAFTEAPGWYAVVTRDGRILIFERETGRLKREIAVEIGD